MDHKANNPLLQRWRKRVNMRAVLGIGGVPEDEIPQARRFGQLMETAVLVALALVFMQLFMVFFGQEEGGRIIDTIIWSIFAVEFFGSLILVRNRWRYVRNNWMNALIVFLAFPLLPWGEQYAVIFQSLRLMLILRFTVHFFDTALEILRRNRFGQVLGLAALLIVFAGAMFAHLEHRSFSDGIWWALVTITTVGYGDVVPTTENGRVFGAFMIAFGVVLFSLVTANISAFLVGEEQSRIEREILRQVKENNERLIRQEQQATQHLERIIERLAEMEQRHTRQIDQLLISLKLEMEAVAKELKALQHDHHTTSNQLMEKRLQQLEQHFARLEKLHQTHHATTHQTMERQLAHLEQLLKQKEKS